MLAKLRLQENKDEKMENKNIKKKGKTQKASAKFFGLAGCWSFWRTGEVGLRLRLTDDNAGWGL